MNDIFGRKRIKELESQLEKLRRDYDAISWGYLGSIEQRVRRLEHLTGFDKLTPAGPTDGSFADALKNSESKP